MRAPEWGARMPIIPVLSVLAQRLRRGTIIGITPER